MGTCKWATGKAQEIKCHPKPLSVRNPQDAARLEVKLNPRAQLTAFDSSVCVLSNNIFGMYDLWQWCGSRGSAAQGGGEGVLCGLIQTEAKYRGTSGPRCMEVRGHRGHLYIWAEVQWRRHTVSQGSTVAL